MVELILCCLLVYKNSGYLEAVNTCAKLLMVKVATEVKALPNYAASGEVCIHFCITLIDNSFDEFLYISTVGYY